MRWAPQHRKLLWVVGEVWVMAAQGGLGATEGRADAGRERFAVLQGRA
jgi:hypothetical protein